MRAVLLAVAVAVGLAACGHGGSANRVADRSVCDVVGVAQRDLLAPAQVSFVDLVADVPWTEVERDAVAAIRVLGPGASAGRFDPLIDHLTARHAAIEAHRREPRARRRVRALAGALDDLLATGACG